MSIVKLIVDPLTLIAASGVAIQVWAAKEFIQHRKKARIVASSYSDKYR